MGVKLETAFKLIITLGHFEVIIRDTGGGRTSIELFGPGNEPGSMVVAAQTSVPTHDFKRMVDRIRTG